MLGAITFSGTDWLWPLAIAMLAAAFLVIRGITRAPATSSVRISCAMLKLLGISALALCLLEPIWSRARAKPGANFFAILADNSQGMQVRDRGSTATRGDIMKQLLAAEGWKETLSDTFTLRYFTFDARLQAAERVPDLDFSGAATSLAGSLRSLAERYRGQPLAGVLMLTDGNATDMAGPFDTEGLPPIYPVVIGRDDAPADISLQRVAATQTAFEDAPVTIQADVAATGYDGSDIVVQVLDGAGRKVDEQKQRIAGSDKSLSFRFSAKPPKRGISFYTVRVAARQELAAFDNPALSQEATMANNQRAVAVDRGRGPHRILYVAGRPNWEFKFLNRALAGDDELQLVALIRIAKREPKFEFIGRQGESQNPLFRGFKKDDEEVEQYDQPVLTRMNTRDEFELKGGFPKIAEELYAYDAVVIDDLEAAFFTRDQMMLLQKYVSDRGGAILMLGGAETFQEGSYARTPIGDMLPVYLDGAPSDTVARENRVGAAAQMKLSFTREGWLQPWLRLRDNEAAERSRLDAMPAFGLVNHSRDVKPGASVLATLGDGKTPDRPALVAQRFGNGRAAAMMIGDFWRWGFRDEELHRDMDKAWRQLARWLVTDVPRQVELTSQQQNGGGIALETQARNRVFQPVENASVRVTVRPETNGKPTNAIDLACEPSTTAPGAYVATYIPRQVGGYRAEAVILDENGAEVGRSETGWTSDPAAEEFKSLKPNRSLLEQIARRTGGEIVSADSLGKFVRTLPNRKAPITEISTQPLWHTPAMFLFALVCFAGEWGVRRWKGLA